MLNHQSNRRIPPRDACRQSAKGREAPCARRKCRRPGSSADRAWRATAKGVVASLMLGLAVACTPLSPQRAENAAPAFREAVETHLSAVASRNMEALLPTLTADPELTMIAPDGSKFDTRQQYVDFHRQWFAAPDRGRFEFEIVRLVQSQRLAQALVRYRYSSADAAGAHQSTAWLSLTFALEDGAWRLVFDQNTAIAPAVAP